MDQISQTDFEGWFDPYTFIMFVPSLGEIRGSDVEACIGEELESTDDPTLRLMLAFFEFDDSGGLRLVGGSPPLYGSRRGFSFWHEYAHYLQALRSVGMIGITHDIISLLSSRQDFKEALAQGTSGLHLSLRSKHSKAIENLSWYRHPGTRLSVSHILDSEAELLAQYIGGNIFRFRYYVSGVRMSAVTRHFESIRHEKPGYSEAYLLAESTLGFRAPAVMPLLTYFALSQPIRRDSGGFNPISPEVAFKVMLEFLANDPECYAEYYHYAYDLYKTRSVALNPEQDPVHRICMRACETQGWEYTNTPKRRREMAESLGTSSWPYAQKIGEVVQRALDIERKYGMIVFLEPFNNTAHDALTSLPSPLVVTKIHDNGGISYHSSEFWQPEAHFMSASLAVGLGGASFRLLDTEPRPLSCHHVSSCPHATARLCGEHWPLPHLDWNNCAFPERFAYWFGRRLSDCET